MFKKLITLLTILICIGNTCLAMSFSKGDNVYLQRGETATATTTNGEKIKFICYGKSVKLMSADERKNYLSFENCDDAENADFTICAVNGSDPAMQLWEITASRGAHAKNSGYWLVGQYGNDYVTFISIDSLANMGYTANEWHKISTKIMNGKYVIESSHDYMPPDAQFQYQRKNIVDLRVSADWDNDASWFKLDSI